MAFTLDPTKPPDTGESPTLGASRIRNVSAFLLQMLGFSGLASQTLSVAPFTVDPGTGLVSLAGNAVSGTQAVPLSQFTTGSANGGTWFKLPGGLIVQFMLNLVVASSGSSVTLPTSFTSASSYAPVACGNTSVGVAISIVPSTSSAVIVSYTGGGAVNINILAVGS